MVQPDVSDGLPTGSAGSAERLITPRDRTTRHNDGTGVFRTTCDFSHMNFDDPIVFPGQAGASHLHAYFGNTDVDADSTEQSIANSGNSTCHGGVANRSGYWVPALLDEQTGKPVTPDFAIVYYKSGYRGVDPGEVQAMPDGLRMVAGEARSTGPGDNEHGDWVCLGDSSLGGTKDHSPTIPTDCRDGDKLRMSVEFPQCWDGQNLDSADHRSHMAYAKGGCPDSHPVPLPVITMNVDYVVTDADLVDRWRLSSDMYDRGERGGASAHADWFNGWQSDVVDTWLDHCYTPAEDCGTNNLNDGTGLAKP
jgi:hypothetical protein